MIRRETAKKMGKQVSEEKGYFDQIALDYDDMTELYSPYSQLETKRRADDLERIVGQYGTPLVLEIGCGTGEELVPLSQFAQANCWEMIGVDVSEGMLRVAKSKMSEASGIQLIVANALHLPFGDETFDVVICVATFHHLPDLHCALNEINRLTKEAGTIYIEDRINNKLFDFLRKLGVGSGAERSPHEMKSVPHSVPYWVNEIQVFFLIQSVEFRGFVGSYLRSMLKSKKVATLLFMVDKWCSRIPFLRRFSLDVCLILKKREAEGN